MHKAAGRLHATKPTFPNVELQLDAATTKLTSPQDPKRIEELQFLDTKFLCQVIMATHIAKLGINMDADGTIISGSGPHSHRASPPIKYRSGGLGSAEISDAECSTLEGSEDVFQEQVRRLRLSLDDENRAPRFYRLLFDADSLRDKMTQKAIFVGVNEHKDSPMREFGGVGRDVTALLALLADMTERLSSASYMIGG